MHAGPVSPRTEELLEERLGQRLGGEALTPQPYAPGRYRYTDSEEGTEPSEELLRSGRGIEAPARGQVDTESEEEGVGQMRGDFFAEGEQRQIPQVQLALPLQRRRLGRLSGPWARPRQKPALQLDPTQACPKPRHAREFCRTRRHLVCSTGSTRSMSCSSTDSTRSS